MADLCHYHPEFTTSANRSILSLSWGWTGKEPTEIHKTYWSRDYCHSGLVSPTAGRVRAVK